MIGEVIKEYLVSLGVKIDKPGFNQMQTTLNQTSGVVASSTSGWAKDFVKAGTLISTALASITASVAGIMTATAKQDLAMEKYSRSMLVSKSAALEMKTAIDALGESIQDIQLSPELMGRYRALVADGRSMKVGGDYASTMKEFRDLIFEFTRLKQESSYALQWVGYYLMKHLLNPLREGKATFKSFNDSVIKNMPVWTERIARGLIYGVNVGRHFLALLKAIGKTGYDVWDSFPVGVKIAIAALSALSLFIKASPMGKSIALISTMLLLIDDYFGYMEGKKAALGPLWDKLNIALDKSGKYTGKLKTAINDTWDELRVLWAEFEKSEGHALSVKTMSDLFILIEETLTTLIDLSDVAFTQIGKATAKNGVLHEFKELFYDTGQAIDDVAVGLTEVMKQLGLLSSDSKYKGFWSWFGDELSRQLKRLANFGSIMAKLVQLNWAIMGGDFKKAGAISRSIIGDASSILGSYFDEGSKAEANGRSGRKDINSFEEFLSAISEQESGGNYSAVGGIEVDGERALGKFQIMPSNWPSWAQEAGLSRNAPTTPENQEIVARYKLKQYYNALGPEGALVAWYAGYQNGERWRDGEVDAIGAGGHYSWDMPQAGGAPSVREYVEETLGRIKDSKISSNVDTTNEIDYWSGDKLQNPPGGMREPTWVDYLRDWWKEHLKSDSADSSASSFVRPSSYFENAFANADPMIVNSLMRGGSPAYAQGSGGSVTTITYQVEVGGVEVKNTNASAEDIGREVGNKTVSSIQERAEYFKMNRVLNGIQV